MSPLLRHHPRLLVAIAVGTATFFALPSGRDAVTGSLVAWNAGCWAWVLMMGVMMSRQDAARVRDYASEEDVGAGLALLFVCLAACASLVAIVLGLGRAGAAPGLATAPHYLLAAATVAGSWLALGIAFTSHYAHVYYTSDPARPPLRFPDPPAEPGYWDFIYFSFTISVAAQTSDVTVMTTDMRRLVVAHSVLGFLFNAAIIGFTINVFAGSLAR